uniref:synaptotagmin-like protein 1 isoform X2 n=1 Tax=Pristiophorus japonicus TaxID=55135 RepID=UPI00398ED4BE
MLLHCQACEEWSILETFVRWYTVWQDTKASSPLISLEELSDVGHLAMELEFNVEELIDLNFLTDEEQNVIVQVLYRDAELRLLEDQRIKKLQQSVLDPEKLKIATGDWFKEVRAKRHTNKQIGSDIVRASIRKKKRTKGERQKRVTINDEKIIINEQEDEDPEQQENVNCAATNEDTVSPEHEDAGMDEADCEQSEIHKRYRKNEQEDEGPEQQENVNCAATNEDIVSPEHEDTGMDEADCEQSEIHERSDDDKNDVTLKLETVTLHTNTQTERNDDMASESKVAVDDDLLRTEEGSPSVPVITVQSHDEIDGDTCSQNSDESSVPIKDVDVHSSLSSFQTPALSGSMMSLYSNADFGCVDVRGSVTFSLHYDENSSEFQIFVVQCDDLAKARKNRSDPYVKTYLLPDKSSESKRKTSVRKKTLNPSFNEQLMYKLEKDELQSRTLSLSVWHSDHFRHNLFLGEVEIPLESWDWNNIKPTSYILQPRIAVPPNTIQSKGQLSLSLKFIPAGSHDQGLTPTAEVHIWLKEARNLMPIRSKGINSFVKWSQLRQTCHLDGFK